MASITLTYKELLDEIKPSLEVLGNLEYSNDTPISHLIDIADNMREIDDAAKTFWDVRLKMLRPFVEKDENGELKTTTIKGDDGVERMEYLITPENKIKWEFKFKELQETHVEVNLKKINKKSLNGISGIKPVHLKGIIKLLK